MKLKVNKSQRYAKIRAHTATHLLHAELDRLLNGTKQAGSYVDEDYLRLDFYTDKSLTQEQIWYLDKKINDYIYQALPVEKKEMKFDEAIKLGAKAFFDEKYGDIVRVVIVKDNKGSSKFVSIELCGGTHADNTYQIGAFKIIGQEAVASGIKRLIAITGPKVGLYTLEQEKLLSDIANKLECSPKQIIDKINKIKSEYSSLKAEFTNLQDKILASELKKLFDKSQGNDLFDKIIFIPENNILYKYNFKQIGNIAKSLYGNINFLIYNKDGNFLIFSGKKNIDLKMFLKQNKLRGGGSSQFVQGKDDRILTLFK